MARVPKLLARKHESEALDYKVKHPRATWQEVADHVGLGSPGAAYDAVYRPIRKSVAANVEDMRDLLNAGLNTMIETNWGFATNDIELVLGMIGKGKDAEPMLDEDGRRVAFVMPSKAMLDSQDKIMAAYKQQSDLFGLKHSDGVAERQVALQEQQVELFAMGVRAVLDALDLTPEQKAREPEIVAKQLALVAGQAIDVTSSVKEQVGNSE